MMQRQMLFDMTRTAFVATTLASAFLVALTLSADARGNHGLARGFGGHGMLGGHGMQGSQFAGDRRHGNDAYTKAASDERDKLLNSKIKSICRGC